MKAIYRRELKSYFTSFNGYIFIAFILLFTGIFAMIINFRGRYPGFEYVIGNMNLVYIIIVPILTMRSLSEDRRQKTDQLLYSLPLSTGRIVWGKYLSMLTVLLIPTVIMCIYPVFLSLYGTVNMPVAYAAIFAFFLLGAALIAIGMFISSLTENQIVAAVLSFGVTLLSYFVPSLANYIPATAMGSFIGFSVVVVLLALILYFMTRDYFAGICGGVVLEIALAAVYYFKKSALEGVFQKLLTNLSVFSRLDNFINGIFDLPSVIFYLTVILLFAFFTVQSMEKRRWS